MNIIAIPTAGLVYHLRHECAAKSVLVGKKRSYSASVSENYFEANKTVEPGDTLNLGCCVTTLPSKPNKFRGYSKLLGEETSRNHQAYKRGHLYIKIL